MFRRDPLRRVLQEVAAMLGTADPDEVMLRQLARTALKHGGVVGVSKGGERAVWPVGGVPAGGVFELASVTKPFTAALVSALVGQGRLAWDTRLSALGGPWRKLPPHLTPRTLATHTAGLPMHPARVALTTFTHFSDPYSPMSAADVLGSARRWARLERPPRFAYSNLGVGLLALAAAYAADQEMSVSGYGAALQQQVTVPLDLPSVTLRPHPAQLVTPRGLLGGDQPTGFGPLVGAGGLFGSAQDLLTFAESHLSGRAGTHWQAVTAPAGLLPPRHGVSLGWFMTAAPTGSIFWHDGVARGTRTALGFRPDSGAAVVVLARGGVPLTGWRASVPMLLLRLLGAG